MRDKTKLFLVLMFAYCIGKITKNVIPAFESLSQGGFWNVIVIIIIIWGLYIAISSRKVRQAPGFGFGVAYTIISVINALLTINQINVSTAYYVLTIPYFFMVYLIAYQHIDIRNERTGKELKATGIGLYLLVCIALYVVVNVNKNSSATSDVFYIVFLLPVFGILNKNRIPLWSYVITGALIIISNKRAAVLGIVVSLAIMYIVNTMISKGKLKSILKYIFFTVAISVIVYLMYNYISQYIEITLVKRFNYIIENRTIGVREIAYEKVIEAIRSSNFVQLIFGHGVRSVEYVVGRGWQAHNDFLQVLFEQGLLPCVLLVCFYISLFKAQIAMIKDKYLYSGYFAYTIVFHLIVAMLSYMVITTEVCNVSMMVFGIIAADFSRSRKVVL